MTRANVEAAHKTGNHPTPQRKKEAFKPAKKPRTNPGTGRAAKRGATSERRAAPAVNDGKGTPVDVAPALAGEHEAAFARVRAELSALPDLEVRHVTVHVPAAAVLALGALPKMRALRGAMLAELTNPPVDALDKLEDYALAAAHAHANVLPVDAGETELRALVNEASPLRERLLTCGAAAASYGLLDPKQIAAIRRGSGHLDLAQDLWALVTLFRKAWPTLGSKVPCTPADLERAAELSRLMLKALGQRDQGTDGSNRPGEAEAQLAKVYELFRRAYEACRHAIVYLRRNEGDADEIAPPLGQSRRRARRSQAEEPAPVEPDEGEPRTDGEWDGEVEGG